jgi:hypothetical protein
MRFLRRAEIVSAFGVAALGVVGILAVFILPVSSDTDYLRKNGQIIGQQVQQVWFMQQVGTAKAISILVMFGLLAAIVLLTALQHALHRLPIDLVALWGATVLLIGLVYLTHSLTAYFFQPCAVLAFLCAVFASIYHAVARSRKPPAEPL